MAAKRGRPKSRREGPDYGTPELQAKRAKLAKGGDPALTEYPLGILLARGRIDRDQHQAGCMYAYLYGKAVGRTVELGTGEPVGGEMDEETASKLRARYLDCKNLLLRHGRRVADAVDNVAVYRRLPRWFWTTRPRPSDQRDYEALTTGLTALAEALIGRRAA